MYLEKERGAALQGCVFRNMHLGMGNEWYGNQYWYSCVVRVSALCLQVAEYDQYEIRRFTVQTSNKPHNTQGR